jgi:FkbM family methyltransferase
MRGVLSASVWKKIDRAREAAFLSLRGTRDLRSKAALLTCYSALLRGAEDHSEVDLTLTVAGSRFPVRMRKSDIFTLAEIFREQQYRMQTPLPRAPLVLDCGSNIGLSAVWFLGQYPGARVHGFEPEPENYRLLERNVGARSDVVLNRAAVGLSAGRTKLHVSHDGATHSVKDAAAGTRTVDVDVISLADYVRERGLGPIDLLKLDVEGSEMDAIEGMGEGVRDVGVIVGEFHEALVDESRFYSYLEQRGFRRVRKSATHEQGVHVFELARG